MKVNFSPYLLVIDLFDSVDDATAAATFDGGFLTLTLTKLSAGDWPDLHFQGSKTETRERRDLSVRTKEAKELELQEAKKLKRVEDGRAALRKQVPRHG